MICCLQDDEDEDSEEDSDDDDTAALLAELEKIKKERAEEQERKVKHNFRLMCLWLPAQSANRSYIQGKVNVSSVCLMNLLLFQS